jgi:flavin-dependent thymidylate synthase
VRLVAAFPRPLDNAVATARTCYSSSGIVWPEDVHPASLPTGDLRNAALERRDRLARDLYRSGHHTTFGHAHFQFVIEGVSRQCIWSFLHSHPFYNSEQVSQRYVEVKPGQVAVPPLDGEALAVYERCVSRQQADYRRLTELCAPVVEAEYARRFPARVRAGRAGREVRKRAQEVSRYLLPVATLAHLYHTISGITLFRYARLCQQLDAPTETRALVEAMLVEVLRHDPDLAQLLEPPLPLDETPEVCALWPAGRGAGAAIPAAGGGAPGAEITASSSRRAFREEFDASLGGRTSLLIDHKPAAEAVLAAAVREVLGLPRSALDDGAAARLVLDPRRNRLLGETLNLGTLDKLGRVLVHPSYAFRKKLSHCADSQDQRHRVTPASRPVLLAHLDDEPDVIVPEVVRHSPAAQGLFEDSVSGTWEAMRRLACLGVDDEWRAYLLPNATAIRMTESADLLGLQHKLRARLCYLAQEEIWRASLDEVRQIRVVHPRLGEFLMPPCGLRQLAGQTPPCPEGQRYCGVAVWKLERSDYQRVI